MTIIRKISMVLLAIGCLHAPIASAADMVTHFIGGIPPANAVGGGNIVDIVNAAARMWAAVYADSVTITLQYGWAPVGDAGTHTLLQQGGTPNREIAGLILFDNSGAAYFYLDPTPDVNDEYRRRTEEYQDLGGGLVNVAHIFSAPSGDAAGHIDLLSVALHEIGHAMGMCAANIAFVVEANNGDIAIAADLPYGGTMIPLASNRMGITSHFDALQITYGALMAGISADERRLPSMLDVLANAQVSGFTLASEDAPTSTPVRVAPPRGTARAASSAPAQRK